MGFEELICGQYDFEEPLPCRMILDMSSSRQTCIPNDCCSGRFSWAAIESIQLAAD